MAEMDWVESVFTSAWRHGAYPNVILDVENVGERRGDRGALIIGT